ncbi:MAG: hypothetical protein B7Z72_01395 [Gemmatimonadetes bacterium 21-71-4]|nr:MAG: hypothetical protein B7Z72_01395 [Gemmatimonadetes bacterium 21-71-4]
MRGARLKVRGQTRELVAQRRAVVQRDEQRAGHPGAGGNACLSHGPRKVELGAVRCVERLRGARDADRGDEPCEPVE